MYLSLQFLLLGLKLCHATTETSNLTEGSDDELFELFRDQGKNYLHNLEMTMYQSDAPHKSMADDDEWEKILANPFLNINDEIKFTSEENIDDDLKTLTSVHNSKEIINGDNLEASSEDSNDYLMEETQENFIPYDTMILPDNLEDVLTPETTSVVPYDTTILTSKTPVEVETEASNIVSYDMMILPDNLEAILTYEAPVQATTETISNSTEYDLSDSPINQNTNATQIIDIDDLLKENFDFKSKFPNLYGKRNNNQRSLAFVFDSTGSMWDDLEQLKEGAEKIMTTMEERDDNPIYNYILVPFHDPRVGPVTVTRDRDLFRQKLEEIDVYGGGDCPEMSLSGISKAVDASLPGSYIYVLTDATAGDYYLVGDILDKLLQKEIQVVFVLTGDCNNRTSPEYTVYEQIAAASSGQVFHLNRSDVNQVLEFVRKTLDSRRENLLVVTNISPTNKTPHQVSVDSSLDQLTISVSGTNPKIDVVNPEGVHISEPPTVEQILNLDNIQVLNVNNPSNGSWEINVSSGSNHSIILSGLTDLRFDHGFSTVVPKNMDETNHRPLYGSDTYLLLRPLNDTTFGQITNVDLIGLQGQPLRHNIPFTLLPGTNNTYISEKFKPPVSFFNLFIKGEDKNNNTFVRLTKTAIKPQYPEKPFVTINSPEIFHSIHVPVNLSCHIETVVPAKVQWFKNNKAVSDRITKEQTGWIHWSDIYPTIHTEGVYICKAENEAGIGEEKIILHMIEPPLLKKPKKFVESLKPGSHYYADCYATAGIPSPGIEWLKNEKIITPDSGIQILLNGTMVIPFLTSNHVGSYQCIATNSAGVDTYKLDIRVEVAPSFPRDDFPTKIEKLIDSSLELHCPADGVPKPFITWLKDGIKLVPTKHITFLNDNSTLIIPQLATNHSGLFTCIAFNLMGSVNKSQSVFVIELPTIQSLITDDTINIIEGEKLTIPCLAHGNPIPNVTWLINSTITQENSNISFYANPSNSGRYECVATNVAGSDSRIWTVVVFTRPIINASFNETIEIRENETLVLVCKAAGFPTPGLKWSSDRFPDQTILENETLSIIGKRNETPVKYKCTAENAAGMANKTVTVIVKATPKIAETGNNSIDIVEHKDLIMPCTANGNPVPNITWYKNDNILKNDSALVITPENLLIVSTITRNFTGVYKCVATNSEGSDVMINNVRVLVPPKVLNTSNNIEAMEGKSIQIQCPVSDSFPPPNIVWSKNGNNVVNTLVSKANIKNNLLFLQTVTIADEGVYICVATNIIGTAEAQIYLTVLYRPKIKNKQNGPVRVKKNVGDFVELKCEADGNPTPKYQWVRNKSVISKNNVAFAMKDLKLSDRDNYTCQASNKLGSDENVYFLDVLEPTKILDPIYEEFDVSRRETFMIYCRATGYPKPEIKWSKLSSDIRMDQLGIQIDNGTLIIPKMDYKHQGDYLCEAINTEGLSKRSVNVKIKVAPIIRVTPENTTITVKENGKFVLECFVEGIPKPELHWDRNGVELTQENFQREFTARSKPLESNTTQYTLTARNVTASLNGLYHCIAANKLGKSLAEFNVTILTSPKLKLETKNQNNSMEAIKNSPGIFVCNIDLGNPPSVISWYKNNEKLTNESNHRIQYDSQRTILKILNASEFDKGVYECRASNPIGQVEQSFNFDVLVPPKSESELPVPIDLVIGDDLKLYCDISGHPKPSIMWLKDSSAIENVNSNEELLILPNATSRDGGDYTCVALNKAGNAKMSFSVKILEPPKFLDALPGELNINASLKHGFVLRCDVGGDPQPNITWQKDDRPILNRPENDSYQISFDGTHLQISNPSLSDAGKYNCKAQNSVGILRRNFQVFLKVMAEWNSWSKWSECDVVCGEGVRKRNRTCNYPEEFTNTTITIDLSKCAGATEETQICYQRPCAVNGGWSDWTIWTSCSTTCGGGVQHRYRYCNNPSPVYGGKNCTGPTIEEKLCNDEPCPKDGNWSDWTDWGPCAATCGISVRYRTRNCNNPVPAYGGKDCDGDQYEVLECIQEPCPINGGWSDWEPWTPCSASCGLGRKIRKRHCTNPIPEYGGAKCIGEPLMIKGCVIQPCFADTSTEYDIYGNISGRSISNRLLAQMSLDGSSNIVRMESLQKKSNDKDGWLPSLVFVVSPLSMNMAVLENADQSEENDDYGEDYGDESEYEQDSKISFQTGQEVIIHEKGRKNVDTGAMEVIIEMNGELPIVQAESKLIIDPFTANYIPTNRNTRRSSVNNYMSIDGKPLKYSWDSEIKYARPQLKKLMVEKISTENIAAKYNPRKKEFDLFMTTNIEDNLDCPIGYKTDRSKNICQDINECAQNVCHSSQICENTIGSYKCTCLDGYKTLENGHRCLDINECVLDIHGCSHNCENLPGGYTCKCPYGMILGKDRRTCTLIKKRKRPRWSTTAYLNPRNNMNEFINDYPNNYSNEMEYPISDFASFLNTSEECPTGFYQKGNDCLDINECVDNPQLCSKAHTCLNTKGAYMCIPAPCPKYSKRTLLTSSCIQFCNETNNSAICSDDAEIAQIITYKTLSIAEKDIILGESLIKLDMEEIFGPRRKYLSYILQDSSSGEFEVFNTHRGFGIVTCLLFPAKDHVHRLTVIGNAYKNAKKTKLLHTTKYIIHIYVYD